MATTESKDKTAAKLKERLNRWEAYVLQQTLDVPSSTVGSETSVASSRHISDVTDPPRPAEPVFAGNLPPDSPRFSSAPTPADLNPPAQQPVEESILYTQGNNFTYSALPITTVHFNGTRSSDAGQVSLSEGDADKEPRAVYTGPVTRVEKPRQKIKLVPRADPGIRFPTVPFSDSSHEEHKEPRYPRLVSNVLMLLVVIIAAVIGVSLAFTSIKFDGEHLSLLLDR